MSNSNNNSSNKSLFLYTALIFLVAIVLIILAFFGQNHIRRSQPEIEDAAVETSAPDSGLTERASVLSEENRLLLEEKTELENQLKSKNEEINRLNAEAQENKKYRETNDTLMSANGYLSAGNYNAALEALNKIDENMLTADQKILYDSIKENL